MRSMSRYRYLLGDSRGEAARLRFQAKLWDPVSHALFDRLGVKPGWKVLEIGKETRKILESRIEG